MVATRRTPRTAGTGSCRTFITPRASFPGWGPPAPVGATVVVRWPRPRLPIESLATPSVDSDRTVIGAARVPQWAPGTAIRSRRRRHAIARDVRHSCIGQRRRSDRRSYSSIRVHVRWARLGRLRRAWRAGCGPEHHHRQPLRGWRMGAVFRRCGLAIGPSANRRVDPVRNQCRNPGEPGRHSPNRRESVPSRPAMKGRRRTPRRSMASAGVTRRPAARVTSPVSRARRPSRPSRLPALRTAGTGSCRTRARCTCRPGCRCTARGR